MLPAKPSNGADDTHGQLAELAAADRPPHRMLACTLYQAGGEQHPVYVHAKIGIVDDRWLTIGSANLNEHSLFNDTEQNLVICDRRLARETRLRLWSEHLDLPVGELEELEEPDVAARPLPSATWPALPASGRRWRSPPTRPGAGRRAESGPTLTTVAACRRPGPLTKLSRFPSLALRSAGHSLIHSGKEPR